MGNAGASIRAAVRIACGLGCAVALTAGVLSPSLCAADGEEPATAEVWSKAFAPAASTSGPATAGSTGPSSTDPAPTTMATPASSEVHALPVASSPTPANLVTAPAEEIAAPPTTQEIPAISSAAPPPAAPAPSPRQNAADGSSKGSGQFDLDSPDVQRYERAQAGFIDPQQQFGNAAAYTADGAFTSPIGVELEEGSRKLANGQAAQGLMVLEVTKGSPAATAGLHGYRHAAHSALQGAFIAAALFPSPLPRLRCWRCRSSS